MGYPPRLLYQQREWIFIRGKGGNEILEITKTKYPLEIRFAPICKQTWQMEGKNRDLWETYFHGLWLRTLWTKIGPIHFVAKHIFLPVDMQNKT